MAKAPTLEVRLIGDVYALRSALAKFLDLSRRGLAFFTSYRYTEAENAEIEAAFDAAKTALSVPPRNCDRFATVDDAKRAYIAERGHVFIWDGDSSERFERWLFATAEGGAE